MSRPRKSRTRALALLSLGVAVAASGVASLGPTTSTASSHREAPRIAGLPQFDGTDVYVFVPKDKPNTVTLIANWIPFEEPAGGPNFYPWATDAAYDINIDNDGDAKPDITYRWSFDNSYQNRNTFLYNTGPVTSLTDPDLNFRETYRLEVIDRDRGTTKVLARSAPVAPSNVGKASMPNYKALRNAATVSLPGGVKSFAGQAKDPFGLDLRVFNLLYGGDLSEVGNDTVAGYNVNTVALQVPISQLTSKGDPVIGVYSTTQRTNTGGKWVQVSRLGMPLVNEVVIPLRDKDRFNASKPKDDAQFLKYVTNPEVPRLIEAIYGIKAPKTPRNDLVQAFLTGVPGLNQPKKVTPSEMLRLNTSIKPAANPKRLGVLDGDTAGFPNGRRLTDDVVDIILQVAEGELLGAKNDLGDAVGLDDKGFGTTFPYVGLPTSGSAVRGPATDKAAKKSFSQPSGSPSSRPANLMNGGAGTGTGSLGNAQPASSSRDTWVPVDVVLPAGLVGLGVLSLIGGVLLLWRRYAVSRT